MKKSSFKPSSWGLIIPICIFLLSCDKKELAVETVFSPEEIEFRGERVIVTNEQQKKLLLMDTEEFTEYYRSLHDQSNLRSTGLSTLSYEELVELIRPHLSVYPDISWEKEISKEDQEKIFKDIPSIRSVEDIREKGFTIFEYYSAIALERILPDIVDYKKTVIPEGQE